MNAMQFPKSPPVMAGLHSAATPSCPLPALIKLTFALAFPLLLSGCVFPDDARSRGVKLSAAMESSAKNNRQDLGGSSSHENSAAADVNELADGVAGPSGFCEIDYNKSDYSWQVPFDVSYATPFNGDIQGIIHFTLTPLSLEDERNFVGLYIGGAIVNLKPGSLPDRGVDNSWMLESGLTYRRYLNSSWTAFSPYVAFNAGFVLLNWEYRNPVFAGGDTIHSDSLEGAEGSLAFGISTCRNRRVSFFGEAGVGGTLFMNTTTQGFDNDVFSNFGFVFVKAGLTIKF